MLDDLIFNAGDAKEAPPAPEGGVPPQRVPGWIRWPIRLFFLPFVWIDSAAQRIARWLIPPPYKKAGKCLKRGNCCHYIMVRHSTGPIGWIFRFWHTEIQGFFFRSKEIYEYEGHKVKVMGCRYLKKEGSCAHYHLRPMICRKWPVIEHFGVPRLLKGCGFKAIAKTGKKEGE